MAFRANTSPAERRKQHPWQDAIRKLDDEQYNQENATNQRRYPRPPLASTQRLGAPATRPVQVRGESVRVNYAYHSSSRRRPRVGIFRETSSSGSAAHESNIDSLELALQVTSKTSSSTTSTTSNSRSPKSTPERSPVRSHRHIPNPAETFEDELAHIHKQKGLGYRKITKKPTTERHIPTAFSPNPTNPFAPSPSPNPTNPFARNLSPATVSHASTVSSNPFDSVENRGGGNPYYGRLSSNQSADGLVSDDPSSVGGPDGNATQASSASSEEQQFYNRLGLHRLCEEPTNPEDIAWRNALYLLGLQPELAQEVDSQGRTALHVACVGHATEEEPPHPPPEYIVRALLIANPGAIQHADSDCRLPIHYVAASCGDVACLQMLLEAHPASLVAADAMGWVPLHLCLQNPHIQISVSQVQVLLGMTLPSQQPESSQEPIRQRRGDHLRLNVEHLDRMRQNNNAKEQSRWEPMQRCSMALSAEILNSYPEDVRVCLRRLAQWERKEHRRQQQKQEENRQKSDASFLSSASVSSKTSAFARRERNPAALVIPQDRRLPLHMIIHRGLLDVHLQSSRVEQPPDQTSRQGRDRNGSETASQRQQHTLIVIVRLLISACPEGLIARDANGHTPLLLAMVVASDVLPSQELLELLLGKRTAGYDSLPSWAHDVPYPIQHAYAPLNRRGLAPAAERYCNPAIVSTLDTCQLPLHIAAEEWGDHSSLLVAIYESYPGAIHVQDARGRMPLHILLQNYRRIAPHPEIVALLLSDRVANTCNDEGQLPFDLLVGAASYLPRDPIPSNAATGGSVVHPDPYRSFRHFFQASILAPTGNGGTEQNLLRRKAEADVFLWRLRSLPPWLRRQACSAPFVQELLLQELSSPTKCAFVMMNFAVLALLLAVFRRQMDLFIVTAAHNDLAPTFASNSSATLSYFDGNGDEILNNVFAEPSLRYEAWNTLAIYGLSAVSIGFQAVFWALSCSLKEFQHLCLFNIWRWVDFTAITTAVVTSVMIHEGSQDELVLTVATVATGMLWCSVVGFLSNWWYGMAFFTGSMMMIVRMIVWPAVLATIFIVGFAEMFYTIAQVDCAQALGLTPVCSLRESYQLVYFLVVGEPVVDIGSPETPSAGITMLLAIFLVLLCFLLLCVLVVVVVATSKSDSESVALDSYWEPKLAFICSSQNSRAAAAHFKKGMWTPQPSRMDRFVARLEELWGVATCLLLGIGKDRYWYATSMPPMKKLFFRAALVVLVPFWVVAGLLTVGLLWPAQIRRFIFRPNQRPTEDAKPNDAREFCTSQVAGVRNEVMKLKTMSYEQSNDIHFEIQQLKAMIATALTD